MAKIMSYVDFIMFISMTFIFFVGLLGNTFVAVIILRRKKMRTLMNWFVLNLAVCEIFIILVILPMNFIFTHISWPFGEFVCQYMVPILEHFAGVLVITHTCIGTARYIVLRNFKKGDSITKTHVIITIIACWIIPLLTMSVTLMGLVGKGAIRSNGKVDVCRVSFHSASHLIGYRISVFLLTYIIPMCATGFSYFKVIKIVQESTEKLNTHMSESALLKRKLKNKSMNRILITMYIVFGITTLPYQVISCLRDFGYLENQNIMHVALNMGLLLFYAQIVTNPTVLLYMGEEYRKEIYKLPVWCCALEIKEKMSRMSSSNRSHGSSEKLRKSTTSIRSSDVSLHRSGRSTKNRAQNNGYQESPLVACDKYNNTYNSHSNNSTSFEISKSNSTSNSNEILDCSLQNSYITLHMTYQQSPLVIYDQSFNVDDRRSNSSYYQSFENFETQAIDNNGKIENGFLPSQFPFEQADVRSANLLTGLSRKQLKIVPGRSKQNDRDSIETVEKDKTRNFSEGDLRDFYEKEVALRSSETPISAANIFRTSSLGSNKAARNMTKYKGLNDKAKKVYRSSITITTGQYNPKTAILGKVIKKNSPNNLFSQTLIDPNDQESHNSYISLKIASDKNDNDSEKIQQRYFEQCTSDPMLSAYYDDGTLMYFYDDVVGCVSLSDDDGRETNI